MSEPTQEGGETPPADEQEPLPFMQRLLDNHFLLLFLGVVVPAVFYMMWGIMEVANIPITK